MYTRKKIWAKNSSRKQWFCKTLYIYTIKKKLGEGRNASSRFTTCAIPTFLPVALEISTLCFYLAESLAVRIKIHWAGFLPGKFSSWRMKVSSWRTVSRNPWSCQCPVKRFHHCHLQHMCTVLIEKNCEASNKAFTYLLKYENPKMGAGDINSINVVIVSKEKH